MPRTSQLLVRLDRSTPAQAATSPGHARLRLMVPVAALSAFLNNTPVAAVLIPAVQDWAKRHRALRCRAS